jgi:acetylornithine/N-succinyldiaminopimelate aminotransferase
MKCGQPHYLQREIARALQPDDLLLDAPRPNLLRFMPALNVTTDKIDEMIATLRLTLDAL